MNNISDIIGLRYVEDFITPYKEQKLIEYIDSKVWDTTLKRRTQHYGHKYVYQNANIKNEQTDDVKLVPKKLLRLFKKIQEAGMASQIPLDKLQVIVNEYNPGQGISAHIDDPKQFGDWVVSVSLGCGINVNFTKDNTINKIYVKNRSVYEMTNDSRYKWRHSIEPVKSDTLDNNIYQRTRRISITFRYMK
jgi:alkylated DNA repair dioxygenase AlkB